MPTSSTDHHSIAVEDYIKQIWKLQRNSERATTKAIADRLDLGRGTVSGMFKHLSDRGLIEHEPYHGVTLTPEGERLALRIIRRHRLIELFLVKTLNLGWEQVHQDAERIEHAVSDELIESIDAFLGHPEADPHGSPIPTASGRLESQNFHLLSEMAAGTSGRVRRVAGADARALTHLNALGIKLGVQLKIINVDPFGTVHVRVGRHEAHLAREAAGRIELSRD